MLKLIIRSYMMIHFRLRREWRYVFKLNLVILRIKINSKNIKVSVWGNIVRDIKNYMEVYLNKIKKRQRIRVRKRIKVNDIIFIEIYISFELIWLFILNYWLIFNDF